MVKVGSRQVPPPQRPAPHPAAEQRQGGGEKEMAAGKIAIGVYSPAKPDHGLVVGSELRYWRCLPNAPKVGTRIARAQAQGLAGMASVSALRPLKYFAPPISP